MGSSGDEERVLYSGQLEAKSGVLSRIRVFDESEDCSESSGVTDDVNVAEVGFGIGPWVGRLLLVEGLQNFECWLIREGLLTLRVLVNDRWRLG